MAWRVKKEHEDSIHMFTGKDKVKRRIALKDITPEDLKILIDNEQTHILEKVTENAKSGKTSARNTE